MTLTLDIPEMETERLRLRAPKPEDFEPLVDFYAGERSRFVGGPLRRDEVWRGFAAVIGHWALRGYGFWSVEIRETGACAYGTLGWPTAISLIDVANAPSKAVAERLGAWPEGEFDHPAGWRGEIWRHPAPAEAAA